MFYSNTLSCGLQCLGSSLKATVLNFAQDASKLKRLQLSMTYFNNSCKMMMGGRKITHLSQQVKNVITLEWQSRKWFWGIFIHECIKWHIFSTHLFSFLDIPPLDAFYFNFPTITSKPDVPTVEALRRPPLTIVFSWLLIFINHFSKFRKWCFVGSLRQACSPMDTNQRRAVHPRTERNWEFAL